MKIHIDREACIGCGLCAAIAPEVFEMDEENIATVIEQPNEITDNIQEAIDSCAVEAIHVED